MKVVNKQTFFTKGRIIKTLILVIVLCLISSGAYLGFTVYQQIKDFDINNLTTTVESSSILDSDGKKIYTFGVNKGKYMTYNQLPENLIDAVIAAEDSRYFVHDGFDMPRILKALYTNILGRSTIAGGSTITQQLIKKTYYPKEEQTIQRKLGEVILSTQATKQTSKEKILELYLNKIYFGKSTKTIGIYAASKYYFNKTPDQLTLPESAMLAGAINSPVYYDPFFDLKKAQNRRNIILSLMYQHGYISKAQMTQTQKVPVANLLDSNPIKTNNKYTAYIDQVTDEIKKKTSYDPTKTNMTIYTYMNKDIQSTLDDIASGESYNYSDKDIQVGSTVQDTKTGRIVGILAGRHYGTSKNYLNYATDIHHQPGSSIKPILDYIPAFEYLYWSTGHTVSDAKYTKGGWTPKNWDNRYHGNVSLYNAVGNSWNLAAINTYNEVEAKVGETKLRNYLKTLGYDDTYIDNASNFTNAYAIGGWAEGTTTLQQASSYATISNGGTYIEPHTINKIVISSTGETIYLDKKANENKVQAFSSASAFLMRNILTSVVKEYSSYSSINLGYNIGAKTGTSNHDGSISGIPSGSAKDYWLCAFSPSYSWSVWCGFPTSIQKQKHKYPKSYNNETRYISAIIAKKVQKYSKVSDYDTPNTVYQAKYVKGVYPYVAPGTYTPASSIDTAWFVKGHGPSGVDQSTEAATLENLASFTASFNENNQLSVVFTAYPKEEAYDKVVYRVQIYNGSSLVTTKTLDTNSGVIDFTPEEGTTYTITGFYAWANQSGTSNKISQSVTSNKKQTQPSTYTATSGGAAVTEGMQLTTDEITFTTTGDASRQVTVTLSGGGNATKTAAAGSSISFTQLGSAKSYTATITDSDGTNTTTLGTLNFTTK